MKNIKPLAPIVYRNCVHLKNGVNANGIINVIGKYVHKFPFDSSSEQNYNISTLHKLWENWHYFLKDRFAINFYNYDNILSSTRTKCNMSGNEYCIFQDRFFMKPKNEPQKC